MNNINIDVELSQNFIDFSHEANCQRAFADARDGLKPGQRACLWEMYFKGYSSSKPHVKSAKISGGTVASWWPHGTTAIYDTFARMSQPWINNIPEVDWHGGNGSIQISGEAAADRYTEARLAKTTEEGMLQNLKKHNVPMKLNFSEDEEWPEVFPAIYPRLMINGCQGIGSTIANVWLPHALDVIAASINDYVLTGNIDYSKLYPSFPTGGIIINQKELHNIYETGKGRVILRGKTTIEDNKILISEMPYQVYVEPFIEQIKELINKEELTGISNILNKSNKNNLLIEIECDETPLKVLNKLYAKTDLQKTFNANQYALVGKTPKLLTYKEYLDIFLNHNYDCIKKEFEFDLDKSQKRLELVIGLIKALEDIDNIINLIKSSESSSDAIKNLISKYQFTELQAKGIVDMKLGRLAKLEKVELNKEKKELTSNIEEYQQIINSEEKRKELYLERFNNFVKKFPNPQKTEITQITEPTKKDKEIEFVEPEKCVVVLTESGLVKRIPAISFKTQRRNGKGVKTQDDITSMVIRTNTIDSLMIFTNKGKMYRLLVNDIPEGTNVSKGQSIKSLITMDINEQPTVIYSIYRDTDAKFVLFTTKNGIVKKTPLDEYIKTQKRTGIAAINIREDDELVSVNLIKDEDILFITSGGYSMRIKAEDISISSRIAIGYKGITLHSDDSVVAVLPIRNNEDSLAIFSTNGMGKKFPVSECPVQNRGGKGLICYKPTNSSGLIAAATLISDEDNILICGDKTSLCISATEIPSLGRVSIGNQLIKGSSIVSVSKV